MNNILVPTDFSPNAMKAAGYAAIIALKSNAVVFLLHVIEPIANNIRQPYPLFGKLQEEITINRMKELLSFQQSLHQKYPGIKTETAESNGTISTSILHFAMQKDVDLIIMGTKGATGLKKIFMGTVAAGTIARTEIPVLVIPDKYIFEVPDVILFTSNQFEKNTDILAPLIEVAKIFSATVYLAVFVDIDSAEAADYLENSRYLNNYLEYLQHTYPGMAFKGELIAGSEFEETIERYNTRYEVDIIAMITYPKSFWEKILQKSITNKMAFRSKIPVLAIPVRGGL